MVHLILSSRSCLLLRVDGGAVISCVTCVLVWVYSVAQITSQNKGSSKEPAQRLKREARVYSQCASALSSSVGRSGLPPLVK